MTTTETILTLIDAILSLWIFTSLLVPGRNMIKDIAIPMLAIITIINMVGDYPETRDSITTIVGWIFGTDLAPR